MARWRARLASVAGLSMLLSGCAVVPVRLPTEGTEGEFVVRPGRPGVVVAAPHGTSDPRTGEIAAELARRTGFGLVVATGFALEPDTRGAPGRRCQVNRPLEGVPGGPPGAEMPSAAAQEVYEAFAERVPAAAQGALAFYAEIHGNNRRASAGRIEVATVGVDHDGAVRLRTLLELMRDAHLGAHTGAPRLEILVEPADEVLYAASGAKRLGILRLAARALHIELPRAARTEWREVWTTILADFLTEAVALP